MLYQWEAIQTIAQTLKSTDGVLAIYLKGSFARGEEDLYSDVDLYCIVSDEALEGFLPKRLEILKCYKPILYSSEANFVGPQIVCVFDNGLHFDLYTQTMATQTTTDQVKVLYDPHQLLNDYNAKAFPLSNEECDTLFDECSFVCIEFLAAYHREDYPWAMRLCSHLSGDLSLLLRHLYDPSQAMLGMKRLHTYLPEPLKQRFESAVLAPIPENIQQLLAIQDEISTSFNGNQAFFKHMKAKIDAL